MLKMLAVGIFLTLCLCCTAASRTPADFCRDHNRFPPSPKDRGYSCGQCLDGFSVNSRGDCVECPSLEECKKQRRVACSEKTKGECGDCLPEYMAIYKTDKMPQGICVTEKEVREVITKIEEVMKETTTKPQPANHKSVGEQEGQVLDQYLDKKAQASINGQLIDDVASATAAAPGSAIPLNVAVSDSSASTPADPSGEKRVPLPAASPSAKQKETPAERQPVRNTTQAGFSQLVFFAVVLSVSLVCVTSLVIAAVCWYRLYKQRKSTQPADYSGYPGVYSKKSNGAGHDSGDRKLAQSAQMYHYQHHRQQMMALEQSLSDKLDESELEEEPEENEDGNYTVYECPGLAPAGEMEVKNPVFKNSNNNKSGGESTETSPTTHTAQLP